MITLLIGENSFEIERAIGRLTEAFSGRPEKVDGSELELRQLPDLLANVGLFAEKRLVIIRGLSANKLLWEALPDWIQRMSDDIHLVLVEPTADKRTKTYKALQMTADVKEFRLWTDLDKVSAERWIKEEAKNIGITLDARVASELFSRSLLPAERGRPVFDQWTALHSLKKLSVLDAVTSETIDRYIDRQPVDSVFGLFEAALRGDSGKVHRLVAELEAREDPFRVFGLLSSQVFQLVTLASSDRSVTETAKAIGAYPFALDKLAPFAKKMSKQQLADTVAAFTQADEAMKTSKAAPWILIEQALSKVSQLVT